MKELDLKKYIRTVPDFPKPGILFYDITTLISNKERFQCVIDLFIKNLQGKKIDKVIAIEARGFILGGAIAYKLGAGFIPVRKKGKLPWKTNAAVYNLEYGQDSLHMHEDAINPGENILIIDDVLATGGTMNAVINLTKQLRGNIVSIAFLIELEALKGKEKLEGLPFFSLIKY